MSDLIDGTKLTPTQTKILRTLSDGHPHPRHELISCIDEGLATSKDEAVLKALRNHLAHLRKKIRPIGHDIIPQLVNRQIYYRHIIVLNSVCSGNGNH